MGRWGEVERGQMLGRGREGWKERIWKRGRGGRGRGWREGAEDRERGQKKGKKMGMNSIEIGMGKKRGLFRKDICNSYYTFRSKVFPAL